MHRKTSAALAAVAATLGWCSSADATDYEFHYINIAAEACRQVARFSEETADQATLGRSNEGVYGLDNGAVEGGSGWRLACPLDFVDSADRPATISQISAFGEDLCPEETAHLAVVLVKRAVAAGSDWSLIESCAIDDEGTSCSDTVAEDVDDAQYSYHVMLQVFAGDEKCWQARTARVTYRWPE